MLRLITLTLIVLLFVGCSTPAAREASRVRAMDEVEIRQVSDQELIRALQFARRDAVPEVLLQEGVRRDLWPEQDLPFLRRKEINIGISENTVLAIYGIMQHRGYNTMTEHGLSTQWVFYSLTGDPVLYVYVVDGKVVAIQN